MARLPEAACPQQVAETRQIERSHRLPPLSHLLPQLLSLSSLWHALHALSMSQMRPPLTLDRRVGDSSTIAAIDVIIWLLSDTLRAISQRGRCMKVIVPVAGKGTRL